MKTITLTISLAAILSEVARKSAYTGAKKEGDDNALDRISTVDEDETELKSFFDECRIELTEYLRGTLDSEGLDSDNDTYNIAINVSDKFNDALQSTMQLALKSFFVKGILSRWFGYTNAEEAAQYAMQSASALELLWSKSFVRYGERKMSPF